MYNSLVAYFLTFWKGRSLSIGHQDAFRVFLSYFVENLQTIFSACMLSLGLKISKDSMILAFQWHQRSNKLLIYSFLKLFWMIIIATKLTIMDYNRPAKVHIS